MDHLRSTPRSISIPLQVTVGEPATYNVIRILLALPLAAFSAFLLCRRVTGSFWPSVLGGYLFGFCPYMLSEVLGHLDLLVFRLPESLIALVTLKNLAGEYLPDQVRGSARRAAKRSNSSFSPRSSLQP